MSPFLAEYIESYDAFVSAINSVSYLIFGACVFLISRKFGIVQDGPGVRFSHTPLLVVAMVGCFMTFIVNFFIQGSIARFFSETYLREVPTHIEFRTCRYGGPECGRESPAQCFQRLREDSLRYLGMASIAGVVLSLSFFGAWFLVTALRRTTHEDKESLR